MTTRSEIPTTTAGDATIGPVDATSEPAPPLDLAAVLSGQAEQGSGQQLEAGEG